MAVETQGRTKKRRVLSCGRVEELRKKEANGKMRGDERKDRRREPHFGRSDGEQESGLVGEMRLVRQSTKRAQMAAANNQWERREKVDGRTWA